MCAGAIYWAGIGRVGGGVEGAAGEELEAVGPRRARGDEALGVGGAGVAGKLQTASKLVA